MRSFWDRFFEGPGEKGSEMPTSALPSSSGGPGDPQKWGPKTSILGSFLEVSGLGPGQGPRKMAPLPRASRRLGSGTRENGGQFWGSILNISGQFSSFLVNFHHFWSILSILAKMHNYVKLVT